MSISYCIRQYAHLSLHSPASLPHSAFLSCIHFILHLLVYSFHTVFVCITAYVFIPSFYTANTTVHSFETELRKGPIFLLSIYRFSQMLTIASPPDLTRLNEFGNFDMAHLGVWNNDMTGDRLISAPEFSLKRLDETEDCKKKKGNVSWMEQ